MKSSSPSIPEWKLERLALGELSESETTELRTRLESDPEAAAQLAALEESNQEILAAHPPAEMVREIERRRHLETVRERNAGRQKLSRSLVFGIPSLAAVATLAIVMTRTPPPVTVDPFPPEHTTIKGATQLHIHRQTAEGDEELKSGSIAHPGDLLQVTYKAGNKHHGLIVSLDGRRAVTVHLTGPDDLHSAPLDGSGEVRLERAYELDDAPDFERFYFFFSDTPFETSAIIAAVKASGGGPLELKLEAVDHITFDLRKETP